MQRRSTTQRTTPLAMAGAALLSLALLGLPAGCENLPGTSRSQGAVIGGVAGAGAGAAIAKNNRLLGALIGAAAGAGGGYLIGATLEKSDADSADKQDAIEAAQKAERYPARAEDVETASTADLNSDGFVTMDEVIAMDEAGLSDAEMIQRLDDTGQVFELTQEQEDYLVEEGVSRDVVERMEELNAEDRERALARRTDVLGRESSR